MRPSCLLQRIAFYARPTAALRAISSLYSGVIDVFDRRAKRRQKNRTCVGVDEDFTTYHYLRDEVAYRVVDRMRDVSRSFELGLDLGCGHGHIVQHIDQYDMQQLVQCDLAEKVILTSHVHQTIPTTRLHVDEEFLPFKDNVFDVVLSSLSLHWVNDLPGSLQQICEVLKEDGCFIGSMFATDTLYELRSSFLLAEQDREGGMGQHISPFTSMQDMGGLLTQSGFNLTTIDIDDIVVNYPTMFELMKDLRRMGENNAVRRRRSYIPRETLIAAAAIYKTLYGNEDGSIPATFRILSVIGWKPSKSQPQPAARGSSVVSLKDLEEIVSNDRRKT